MSIDDKRMLVCPKCGGSNTARVWDEHTKHVEGYERICGLSTHPLEDHQEQESLFRCPNCNKEIEGIRLLQDKDVEYDD